MRRRMSVAALAAILIVTVAACRPDTGRYTPVFNATHSKVLLQGVDTQGSGHVGLDILLGSLEDPYNPCHQHHDADGAYNDSFYSACQDSRLGPVSYVKHWGFTAGGAEVANGKIAWSNFESNVCGGKPWCAPQPSPMFTDWARKTTSWAIEFYPYRADEGGVRIAGVPHQRGPDWAESDNLGVVRLPRAGAPGITTLSGIVRNAAAGRFQVDVFQTGGFWLTTSTGYPEQGFSSNTSAATSYASKPLPTGRYHVVFSDLVTGASYGRDLDLGAGTRIDLDAAAPCFGVVPAVVPHTPNRVC